MGQWSVSPPPSPICLANTSRPQLTCQLLQELRVGLGPHNAHLWEMNSKCVALPMTLEQ